MMMELFLVVTDERAHHIVVSQHLHVARIDQVARFEPHLLRPPQLPTLPTLPPPPVLTHPRLTHLPFLIARLRLIGLVFPGQLTEAVLLCDDLSGVQVHIANGGRTTHLGIED